MSEVKESLDKVVAVMPLADQSYMLGQMLMANFNVHALEDILVFMNNAGIIKDQQRFHFIDEATKLQAEIQKAKDDFFVSAGVRSTGEDSSNASG